MLNIHFSIEKWKWNPKYELYVSTHGRFRNASKKFVEPKIDQKHGYCSVYCGGEKHGFTLAHRVVLETWRPCSRMDMLTVDHNDHNKRNNRVNNLEWVTEEENMRRAKADCIRVEVSGNTEKVEVNVSPAPAVSTKYAYCLEIVPSLTVTVEQMAKIVSTKAPKEQLRKIEAIIDNAVKNNRKDIYGFPIKTRILQ